MNYYKLFKDQKEFEPSRNQNRDEDVEMSNVLRDVVKVLDELDVTSKKKEKEDTDVDILVSLKTVISEVVLKDPDVTTAIRDVVQLGKKRTLTIKLKTHAFD